ncbi:MAG TPA: TonB-dependent receptor plug domain-containing protein, partial [Puia sp.]|nr:TonB-dependent receptor plug domain-containing protein [Puia sp.]
MKLSFLFLFGLCLQVSAVGYSQNDVRLSLHFDNLSIAKAISAIEKKSKFHFLYSDDIIPQEFKITLDVKETPLPEIMERVLKNTGLHYKIMENKLIIITLQDKVIKDIKVDGTVTDKTGNPLAGVTVKVKNSTLGTVTDDDGHFVMEVPDDAILTFNSIGYQPMEVRALKTLTISLQESPTALSQVVVVGYGTEKKADLTGAIEQINGKDINSRPVSNIITSLQGLLPGLNIQSNNGNPGASPDINIRGFNSINGGGPLILIDGIEGDIDRVNPMDVESVTVLKDAASAAIYGARGAFGV